jgi:hypothetical protein
MTERRPTGRAERLHGCCHFPDLCDPCAAAFAEKRTMSALIIRIPQDKRERLKQVGKARNISVTKLIDEMATLAIVEHDAEVRFRLRAKRGRGKVECGLKLLRKAARSA